MYCKLSSAPSDRNGNTSTNTKVETPRKGSVSVGQINLNSPGGRILQRIFSKTENQEENWSDWDAWDAWDRDLV
jgi:hypothetical protein